jgi:hypothetical protein
MALGTFNITLTAIPITNSLTPDPTGRSIVAMAVPQALQVFGSTALTSGNVIWPPGSGTSIGTWSYTAPT